MIHRCSHFFHPVFTFGLLLALAVMPVRAGSLINQVLLVTQPDQPVLTQLLQQTLGNGYEVAGPRPKVEMGADVVIVALPTVEMAEVALRQAVGISTVDRVILSAPAVAGDRVKLENQLARFANLPKVYCVDTSLLPVGPDGNPSLADLCLHWSLAAVQPEDAKVKFSEKLASAWKNEGPLVPGEWRGFSTLTLAKLAIQVRLPQHPRPGQHVVWMSQGGKSCPSLDALALRFLGRGFPIVVLMDAPDGTKVASSVPEKTVSGVAEGLARWRKCYELCVKAGFNRQGVLLTHGGAAEVALAWATDDPWRTPAIHLDQPVVSARIDESILKLSTYWRNEAQGIAFSVIDDGGSGSASIQRLLETASGPSRVASSLNVFRAHETFLWLHRHSQLMSSLERYLTRERFSPLYAPLSRTEVLARHAKSGWGDKPQLIRPGQNYFKGKPSGFDKTQDFWRLEKKLVRSNGKLSGPTICLTPEELKTSPKPAVLLKECTDAFGDLAWHWEEDCRNTNDVARIQSLILDLAEHVSLALQRWNDNETSIPGNQYDIKSLNRLAGISRILPPDQSRWIGLLALSDLKDRFKEEPYNDMDILRWTATFPPSLNLFRDPETKHRHLLEIADYFDRVFHNNTGCGMEGTPQHHGTWHYSYASYSIGSGYSVLRNYHDLGVYFSKNTYDRFKKAALNMALLARPDLYGSVAPHAYNARVGENCYLRWQPLSEACKLGDGIRADRLDPQILSVLARVDPANKLLAEVRQKNEMIPDAPMPAHLQINAGALATHQYDRVQVSASGLSAPFGARVEIYMNFGSTYYSLYLKSGSLLIRSPDADNAERWNHYDGFDHSFIPGATSIVTTDRELLYRGVHGGVNTSGIGGGTFFQDNETGINATHIATGPGPLCKKSFFFFGGRITALTSNVKRWKDDMTKAHGKNAFLSVTNPARPIVTTLWQWPATNPDPREKIEAKPLIQPLALADTYGNGYVVHPNPNATWHFRSGEQNYISTLAKHLKPGAEDPSKLGQMRHILGSITHDGVLDRYLPAKGHWDRAWIEHSKADGSDSALAAYTLLVRGGKQKADILADRIASGKAPYSIWQQDNRAHVLRDHPTATTGYVIFEGGDLAATEGILRSATGPCYVMLREDDASHISVSFVNADSAKRRAIRLMLKGAWTLPASGSMLTDGTRIAAKRIGDMTELTIHAPPAEDFLTFGAAWTGSYYQTRHLLPAVFQLNK